MADLFSGGHTGGGGPKHPFDSRFSMVVINWVANPFRGDRFEELWRPSAALTLNYGATAWAFNRSKDDPLQFMQVALFEKKLDFERYWYSEQIAEARIKCAGLFQVPLLPIWYESVGFGFVTDNIGDVEAA